MVARGGLVLDALPAHLAVHQPDLLQDELPVLAVLLVLDQPRGVRGFKGLQLLDQVRAGGTLSERVADRLRPFEGDPEALREQARTVYLELCDCLADNRVWAGRFATVVPAAAPRRSKVVRAAR